MAVDLKSNTMFRRLSLVLDADCLVMLEHDRTKDRVRRILFDRVEQVSVSRTVPVVRILILSIFIGLPGIGLLFTGYTAVSIIALFLLLLAVIGDGWYLYCRKTTLRIVRAGKAEDIVGIFWPHKVRRLVANLQNNIRATQAVGLAASSAPATSGSEG